MEMTIDDIDQEHVNQIEIDGDEGGDVIRVQLIEEREMVVSFYAVHGHAKLESWQTEYFHLNRTPELIDEAIEAVGDLGRIKDVDSNPVQLLG